MKPLRERAILLMKDGRSPDELRVVFIAEGLNAAEVNAVIAELTAQKRQADALDPKRLRSDARWMFEQDASVDHVVAHFVSLGIAEAHARPEAERLLAAQTPFCPSCRTPTGVHQASLPPDWRARLDPRWPWVCSRCWRPIA